MEKCVFKQRSQRNSTCYCVFYQGLDFGDLPLIRGSGSPDPLLSEIDLCVIVLNTCCPSFSVDTQHCSVRGKLPLPIVSTKNIIVVLQSLLVAVLNPKFFCLIFFFCRDQTFKILFLSKRSASLVSKKSVAFCQQVRREASRSSKPEYEAHYLGRTCPQ